MIEKGDLVKEAMQAMQKSYAPFSNAKIGAAVLTSKNKCYTGYLCELAPKLKFDAAERMAFKNAFDKGDKEIKQIIIVSNNEDFPYPSGVSRQMIYELAKEAEIVLINSKGEEKKYMINDLLPFPSKMVKYDY